jgi:hypothetical protein
MTIFAVIIIVALLALASFAQLYIGVSLIAQAVFSIVGLALVGLTAVAAMAGVVYGASSLLRSLLY